MKPDNGNTSTFVDRAAAVIAAIAAILAGVILILHLLTHTAFFDETIQIRYLWYISSGLRPNVDFFCLYPTLGYILTVPFMRMLPESSYIVLALRCIPLVAALLIGIVFYRHGRRTSNEWVFALSSFLLVVTSAGIGSFFSEFSIDHIAAVAAFAALFVFLGSPGIRGAGTAAVLCLASVVIMPKYAFPLFFGMLGYVISCYLEKRSLVVLTAAVVAASTAAILVMALLLSLGGDSLESNFRHAYLLNFAYNNAVIDRFGTGPFFTRTILYVADYYRDNPLLAVFTGLGLSGWIYRAWRERSRASIAGAGILCGTLVSTLLITVFCEQYITPVVLCLAMFAPFLTSFPVPLYVTKVLRLLFVSAVLITLLSRLLSVAAEFKLTPLNSRGVSPAVQRKLEKIDMVLPVSYVLKDYAALLSIIPAKERVVAAWPYHPLLRRDLTFHLYDDRPSISNAFSTNDPLLETFSPNYFRTALESAPPALIVISGLDNYYPPGWRQVAEDFLERHKELYELYPLKMFDAYIRRDLRGR